MTNCVPSFGDKLRYRFDNFMAQGMWAKIRLLLVITAAFIVFAGLLVFLADPTATAKDGLWKTIMLVLGKGGRSDVEGGTWAATMMGLLVVFYAMFFMATLIGLINTGLRSKIDELARGNGAVLENGHTLILGFNETTFALIGELIQANESSPEVQCVAILDSADQVTMEEAVSKRFGHLKEHPKTRIVCRTGSIFDFDDLKRCSILSTKSIIVNAKTDFDTIKAIMACTYILNNTDAKTSSYSVAVTYLEENETTALIAGSDNKKNDRIELLPMQDVVARIMVHTSRQPGLAGVFTELFNFSGHEVYIFETDAVFPKLYGKTIAEINLCLKRAVAIGTVASGKTVCIDAPDQVMFQDEDFLIVIAEDDVPLEVECEPIEPLDLSGASTATENILKALILRSHRVEADILKEYIKYLQEGSEVHIVDDNIDVDDEKWATWKELFAKKGVSFSVRKARIYDTRVLHALVEELQPYSVMVLSDPETEHPEEDDRKIMSLILSLREYRSGAEHGFGITSEMNLEANRELASATSSDDYIVGRHIAALLMAQVSQNRKMRDLFHTLLASEGFEVYIKKASNYVPLGEKIDLYSTSAAVAKRGDILIGLRQKQGGRYYDPIVNPPKRDPHTGALKEYVFDNDDFLVVLSEDMSF